MDELNEFMEQEACDTMDTVTVFDLPCGSLMRYCKLDEEEDTEEKTPYSHAWTEADKRRFKRANRARKKENERLLKLTEALTDEEVINRFAERNRGLQTHFAYFSTIADAAINNKWVIGYATYRKRMKKEDIHKEHRSLKNWLHKNGKDTMTAISIGWGRRVMPMCSLCLHRLMGSPLVILVRPSTRTDAKRAIHLLSVAPLKRIRIPFWKAIIVLRCDVIWNLHH